MNRKQDEERYATLERLLEQSSDQDELALERGQVLQRLGYYDQALAAYTQALRRHPENGEARRARGQLFFERGYLEQALQDWDNLLISQQADEGVYLGRIQTLIWFGNYHGRKGADEYCNEAIAAYPDQTTFYLQKALNPIRRTYPYDEQFVACEQVLFLCRQQRPGLSSTIYRDEGQALYLLGRYEEALAAFEQALYLDSTDPRTYLLKARTLQASGQKQSALAAFEAALQAYGQRFQRYPHSPLDLLEQGELLCSLQRFAEGQAIIEQVLQVDPGSARGWFTQGEALVQMRRYPEALFSYEQAVKLSPRYEEVNSVSGCRLGIWLRYARALADCENKLFITPEDVPLLVQKAHFLSELKRYEEALPVCERALHLSLSSALQTPALLSDIYFELGVALQALNRYEEAFTAYRQSDELQKRKFIGSYEFHYIVNCLATTVQAQKKLRYDPADVESMKLLLRDLTTLGNRQAAEETYQTICQSMPDDLEILLQVLSFAHYNRTAALICYERALRLAPDDARVSAGYAELLYDLRRYDEALRACEQAKQRHADKNWEASPEKKIVALFQQRDRILNNMSNASAAFLRQGGATWNAWRTSQAHYSRDLRSLDLSQLDLHTADLSQMDLQQSVLNRSDLREVNFQQANLQQASISQANLSGANLRGANLFQSTLKGAFLFLPKLTAQQCTWQRDELLPPAITDLCDARLSGADLSHVCLDYTLFDNADLCEANLTSSLLRFANLHQANLSRANLWGASLVGADLSGARLCEANLVYVDLRGACLDGADLRGATFFETRLENASLHGVDLAQILPDHSQMRGENDLLLPVLKLEHPKVPLSASTAEMRSEVLTTLLRCQAPGCNTTMKLELVAEGIPHEDDQYQAFRAKSQKPASLICDYLPGYTTSWHPTGLTYSRIELALRGGDVALLNHLDKQYTPFYCSRCHGVYCYNHMDFKEAWDDFYPHPDYWYGKCPYGHKILVNH